MPPELSLVRLKSAKKFIEACLQAECRRPSAAELLSYEFISPNEEDDFLEVRVRLDTVVEQATSLELEDDEDNSDEEPLSSGIQRDHLIRQPSPMLPDNGRMDQSHVESGHHRGFGNRSESRSTPRIPSESAEDPFAKPPLSRAKTLSHLSGDVISQQHDQHSGPLSDPETKHTNFSQTNPNVSSPEKKSEVEENVSNETPDPSSKTPDQMNTSEEISSSTTTTPNVRRRLSGNASGNSHEFHKTTSRVLRVCLAESGSRDRSGSFFDVPLSPMTPLDQYSLLPNSGVKPSFSHSDSGLTMSATAATSSSSDAHHIFHDPNSSHTSYPSYAAVVATGGGALEGAVIGNHDTPQNFLGVVDVGDKGSFDVDGKPLDENCLIFRLRVPFQTTFKEIEFGFDLLHDHPQSIVDEMNEVDELIFLTPYAKQIVNYLTPIVEIAKQILSEMSIGDKATTARERNQDGPTLSDLVLERYLATREGKNDPALTAWSNAAEERRIKDNPQPIPLPPLATAVPVRTHQPIQVNLGTELHHLAHGQGDESNRSGNAATDVHQSRSSKSITRSVTQSSDPEKISSSTSIPSLVRDKSSNTSPTKMPSDGGSPSGLRDGKISILTLLVLTSYRTEHRTERRSLCSCLS